MLLKEDELVSSCKVPSLGPQLMEGILRKLLCIGALKAKVMSHSFEISCCTWNQGIVSCAVHNA